MAISEILQSVSGAQYLCARRQAHDRTQGLAAVEFLFAYFSGLLFEGAQAGDTFLALSDAPCDRPELLALPPWQANALLGSLLYIEEALMRPWTEFAAGAALADDQNAAATVDRLCDALSEEIQLAQKDQEKAHEAALFARHLLRFCYVCARHKLDTVDRFLDFVADSPFFVDGKDADKKARPVVFYRDPKRNKAGLWLHRSWYAERRLAGHIERLLLAKAAPIAADLDLAPLNAEQQRAVIAALENRFCIITGGPGTGKTFTVARLVKQLMRQTAKTRPPNIALVAPTGKAAQRMQESLYRALQDDENADALLRIFETKTAHRLLGLFGGEAKYDEKNPLPYDTVIVDEASMLGVDLAARLCAAVASDATLILLGDVEQLAAVEAGAVLADLCAAPSLQAHRVRLVQSRRFGFDSAVGALAAVINQNDATQSPSARLLAVQGVIDRFSDLAFVDLSKKTIDEVYADFIDGYRAYFCALSAYKNAVLDAKAQSEVFLALNAYRVLSAGHQGALGDRAINAAIAYAHLAFDNPNLSRRAADEQTWYHGRAVMITKNHYRLGLFNGDMGVCVEQDQGFVVYFEGKDAAFSTALLPERSVVSAYAITAHKSQGSEFDKVAIALDRASERLLSKELLYTAVTRAKKSVDVYATPSALALALQKNAARSTGLPLFFDDDD